MATYGETIYVDEYAVDTGAICDESLVSYYEDIKDRLARGGYGIAHEREMDEDALSYLGWEIDYRLQYSDFLDEDLDGAYRCRLGCCDD